MEALRAAVPALREAEIPFMLGGSMAVWAYGGPEPSNDLDLMLRAQDAERALQALARRRHAAPSTHPRSGS